MNIELKERFEMQAYNLLRKIEEHQKNKEFFAFVFGILVGASVLAIYELIVVPLGRYVEVLIVQ